MPRGAGAGHDRSARDRGKLGFEGTQEIGDKVSTTIGAVSASCRAGTASANVGPPGLASYAGPFMPDCTLVDLFTSYRFDSGFEIGATVVNLFDADYTPALTTPIVPFGPATPTYCLGSDLPNCSDYGRGRTFLLTAEAQF